MSRAATAQDSVASVRGDVVLCVVWLFNIEADFLAEPACQIIGGSAVLGMGE